jgi:hypothetical protein
VTGPAWLRWPLVGRLATRRTVGPVRWEPGSLVACSARRQTEAVINRDSGSDQGITVGPCSAVRSRASSRVGGGLEAVVLMRPDTVPAGGWGE